MKRFLILVLAALFTAALFPAPALADTYTDGVFCWDVSADGKSATLTSYKGSGGAVNIPETLGGKPVVKIAGYVFSTNTGRPGRSDITSVSMGDMVTEIGEYAFYGCESIKTVKLSLRLEKIGLNAFQNCCGLTEITLPDTLKEIGEGAFDGCGQLAGIKLPQSLTVIGAGAFKGCRSLVEISVPGSVGEINDELFANCISLKTVVLNEGTAKINGNFKLSEPFNSCYALQNLYVPKSVRLIGGSVFAELKRCAANVNIHCYQGSAAQNLAFDNALKTSIIATPPAPGNVRAVAGSAENSIRVSWDKVDSAAGYYVERSAGGKNFEPAAAIEDGATVCYDDNNIVTGTEYRYRVCAYTVSGALKFPGEASATAPITIVAQNQTPQQPEQSQPAPSQPQPADPPQQTQPAPSHPQPVDPPQQETPQAPDAQTPQGTTPPQAAQPGQTGTAPAPEPALTVSPKKLSGTPSNLKTVAVTSTRISLGWGAVSGATGYQVYRSSNGGKYALLKSVEKRSYADANLKPGTRYSYKVRAYKISGSTIYYSGYSKAVTAATKAGAPAAPAGFKAAPAGTDSMTISWGGVAGAKGYELQRSTKPGGNFKTIKTLTGKKFTDTKLTPGVKYYYRVRSYNAGKVYSAWTGAVSATPKLPKPAALSVSSSLKGGVRLSWGAVKAASGYEVWRSADGGAFALIKTLAAANYTDAKTVSGVKYSYKVRAYKLIGGKKYYGGYSAAKAVNAKK